MAGRPRELTGGELLMNVAQQAVKTAGDRLERIEVWCCRTAVAAMVAAVFAGAMTLMVGYMAVDYLRAKAALAEAQEKITKSLSDSAPSSSGSWPRGDIRRSGTGPR